jgi:YebC/PmpR family DNA-binding regulatory protein
MSGHSKWSTIKRKKGALDAARGKLFGKLIKEITVAARIGGADENSNPRLRQVVLKAKAANMPNSNIERAIAKGSGTADDVHYEELIYEGYGPGGVAVIIEVMTDNKNRTVGEVRHTLTRSGGNLAENGAVAWNFDRVGLLAIDKGELEEDDLLMIVMDAGAENIDDGGDIWEINCSLSDMENVRLALVENELEVKTYEPIMKPKTLTKVEGADVGKVLKMIDALEDNDDVQNVYTNFDADEEDLAGQ